MKIIGRIFLICVILSMIGLLFWAIFLDDGESQTEKTSKEIQKIVNEEEENTGKKFEDNLRDGPYREDLEPIASQLDLSEFGEDWVFSVVEQTNDLSVNVMTGRGSIALYPRSIDSNTPDSCRVPDNFLPMMMDKGDAIVWLDNEDLIMCPSEIFVVATADEVKEMTSEAR